jgi:hypothetical protein
MYVVDCILQAIKTLSSNKALKLAFTRKIFFKPPPIFFAMERKVSCDPTTRLIHPEPF